MQMSHLDADKASTLFHFPALHRGRSGAVGRLVVAGLEFVLNTAGLVADTGVLSSVLHRFVRQLFRTGGLFFGSQLLSSVISQLA